MKKTILLLTMIIVALIFSFCSATKKAATAKILTTYETNVAPVIMTNCAPCHFPGMGGRKKRLDNFISVSAQINEVLRRIQLNPTDKGFMPDKHAKLADSTIDVFKQWKEDGLLEK